MTTRVLVGLLFVACGGSAPVSSPEGTLARIEAPSWRDGAATTNDELSARMRALADHLAPIGWEPTNVEVRGLLLSGQASTTAIVVPHGECLAMASIASAGIADLDATVFNPDGVTLAQDVEADPHPTVVVCGDAGPREVYVVLQAYAGSGAVLLVAFRGRRDRIEPLVAVVGGRPGVAGASSAEERSNDRQREIAIGLARRGFAPERPARSIPFVEGRPIRSPFAIEAATCYTVAAFPSESASSLDIRVLDADDHEIVRDDADSADALAQFCATNTENGAIEVSSVRGDGTASLMTFRASVSRIGDVRGLWLGTRTASRVQAAELDAARTTMSARLAEAGWRSADRAGRAVVGGEAFDDDVVVPPRSCMLVAAVPGRGVGRARVTLDDGSGVAWRDPAESAGASVVCSVAGARKRAAFVVRTGRGELGIERYVLPMRSENDDTGFAARFESALASAILDGWVPTRELVDLSAGATSTRDVSVAPGTCVDVVAVRASGETNVTVGDGTSATRCASSAAMTVRIVAGAGERGRALVVMRPARAVAPR